MANRFNVYEKINTKYICLVNENLISKTELHKNFEKISSARKIGWLFMNTFKRMDPERMAKKIYTFQENKKPHVSWAKEV